MKPYYEDDSVTIYNADCRDLFPHLTWDVTVTDPPYPGREDLFDTTAVQEGIRDSLRRGPGFVFWPCLAPPPKDPDAAHVWHKAVPIHPRSITGNVAGHQYERILSYGMGTRCEVFRMAAVMPNFAACSDELVEHPTQKPLELMRLLIARSPKGAVLDPFMGSGTTLRAAKDFGRRAIGIEIEERYCEMAASRCAQEVLNLEAA